MIVSLCLCGRNQMSVDLTQIPETHSHNFCLDRMRKALEHCGILLVPSLSVSLPFRQAFWTIYQSVYSDQDALIGLTC